MTLNFSFFYLQPLSDCATTPGCVVLVMEPTSLWMLSKYPTSWAWSLVSQEVSPGQQTPETQKVCSCWTLHQMTSVSGNATVFACKRSSQKSLLMLHIFPQWVRKHHRTLTWATSPYLSWTSHPIRASVLTTREGRTSIHLHTNPVLLSWILMYLMIPKWHPVKDEPWEKCRGNL